MSVADRSKYLRGLLVVVRKDNVIDPRERELILAFGKILDFDLRFCEATIDDLLKNPHITDEPVTFDDRTVAESFLQDGVNLAMVDNVAKPKEMNWLRAVARANGLKDRDADAAVRSCLRHKTQDSQFPPFAVCRHLT